MNMKLARRGFAFAALALAMVLPACSEGGHKVLGFGEPVRHTYSAREFYETTAITGASFSPAGDTILVSTDQSGIFNVWAYPVDGGAPEQLTFSTEHAVFSEGYFPNDTRFLFHADQGGNELDHVYVRELDGTERDLTPGENLKASFAGWSRDLASFYIMTNERDSKYFDLYRYDAQDYSREVVYQNDSGLSVGDVSPDGRWVGLNKVRNNADSDVYLLDLESGDEPVHLTPHEGNINFGIAGFTPDSRRLLISTNEGREFEYVLSYDLRTGERRVEAESAWDVSGVGYSWNMRYRVTSVNADSRTQLVVTDMRSGKPVRVPEIPAGDVTGVRFSRDEAKMAFYVNGDTSPSNLWVLDMGAGTVAQLTETLNPAIKRAHLVESEIVRYPSFDGLEIPAVLYKPKGAGAWNKVPALVMVHGGPGGQARVGYSPMKQFLVNHGYAVLDVNNRGSSGYGKTFFHLDDQRHGEDDLMDVVHGKEFLAGLPWVEPEKIGIIGGSYGGYMVCAALCYQPEVFACGIDIFGVTNWKRTLLSIPPWWEDFREALYAELGDPNDPEQLARLERISPLFHAENITRPMMVIQGANDPRVLQVESDEIVEKVRERGVPVEYVVFPDEGHGFLNKENRITAAEAYVSFLERYLMGVEPKSERQPVPATADAEG